MKKKIVLLMLIFVLVFSFIACGNNEPKEDPGKAKEEYTLGKWEYVARSYTYSGQTFDRHHYYYIPSTFDASKPCSMVLVLHGSTANAYNMRSSDDWKKLAEEYGSVVVIPEGVAIDSKMNMSAEGKTLSDIGRSADDIGYIRFHASMSDPHEALGVDDVKYLSDLIDEMVEAGYVDDKRVFCTGYSHGGFMSIRMAIEAPEKIAGICANAALVLSEYMNKIPSEKVKIVLINGTDDPTVPIDGMHYDFDGDGKKEYTWAVSKDESVDWLLVKNGIDRKSETRELLEDKSPYDGTTVERFAYGEDTAYPVVSYVVYGGGHTWPGAPGGAAAVLGNTTRDVHGSDIIIREFLEPNVSK